jgi:RHS repeat-associated protein
VWDQFGHIIAEHTSAGGVQREYIWLGDTPLAVFDGANQFYVHPDHLDRPVMMTNAAAQTVAWAAKYDPFGNAVTISTAITNNQRLPGQWFQIEDGLAYNWHRTYDATLGRYSQADPLGFVDGPGVYGYAGGSPVMEVDPRGLEHRSGQWKQCGRGCRIRIDYDHVGNGRHLHWECPGSSGEMGEFGGSSHGGNHGDAPNHIKECARRHGFKPEPTSNPAQAPMCGPVCAAGIAIGGVCCVLAPEVCIPGLLLGGTASQN